MNQKFNLGRTLATPGALDAFHSAGEAPADYLDRHLQGDWGEVCDEDKALNDQALAEGTRLLSAYTLKSGARIWIITEANRSATTILLPSEY